MAKVDYSSAAQTVAKYLNINLPKIFAQQTIENKSLKASFEKIKKEALNLLSQFQALELMRKKRSLLYRKHSYLVNVKAYAFIEKAREFFTNETIDYLLVVEQNNQLSIKYATLEEILPMLRIGRERSAAGGGTKIQIRNIKSEISNIKNINFQNEKIEKNIENFYYILTKQIEYYKSNTKIMPGYAIEAAAVAATREASFKMLNRELNISNPLQLQEDLKEIYQKQIGQTPFFGGGDLNNETARELFNISKNIQLQIKNLSSGGASVATTEALKNVLKYLIFILSKPLNPKEIKEIISKELFKSNKQITDILSLALKETTEKELDKFEKGLQSLPSIKLK